MAEPTKALSNKYNQDGTILLTENALGQPEGIPQELHNASGEYGYSNQDIPGPEAKGESEITPP